MGCPLPPTWRPRVLARGTRQAEARSPGPHTPARSISSVGTAGVQARHHPMPRISGSSPARCPSRRARAPIAGWPARHAAARQAVAAAPPVSRRTYSRPVLGYRSSRRCGARFRCDPLPGSDNISTSSQAAPFPLTFLTAGTRWTTAQLKRGEDVVPPPATRRPGSHPNRPPGPRCSHNRGSEKVERGSSGSAVYHHKQDVMGDHALTGRRGVDVVIGACRERDVAKMRSLTRRPPGDAWRHDRLRGRARSSGVVREAAVAVRFLRRHQRRAAARGAVFLCRRALAGHRPDVSARPCG